MMFRSGQSSPQLPPIARTPKQQQNRETRTMNMISEKVIALLLAVAISGTAFNTFIV
ncbi:hypothetical protein GVM20_11185 [Porphyrobacter sp. SLTP]|jgi:hypothetical protein|uniref:hypothetical protein n=1 Tax=Porphyrobacter sp. SLTP TaxID=2683266 RepID=UPI001413528A|nr:hypothetical protein [Porphyrobacter sp. SLTP]NBB25691.1 hypothetical protein [Porphyrobacter sp. SLTP]